MTRKIFTPIAASLAFKPSCAQQRFPEEHRDNALEGWDSAAFSSVIYTRTESCSQSFIYARPLAGNASRWVLNK